ncbi:sensor histidine kinase N-terminal domain-containing protein [Achromobacter sp. GG226]|uniref:sensor histidine kinase n=1 Tax=Verticiella alkaliphila TaxID=2779529 RepID=UPI001C0DE124|nr:sensor histidine kinase [Verticiella sp. GG226]MBU4611051.1 sensor histidine kinase N-terminal domain-containing protein [Verticiella sp. GG226]
MRERRRRARSLKSRLLWWLVPALVLIMLGALWLSNNLLKEQVDTAYDRALAGALRAIDLNISTASGGLSMEQPFLLLEFFQLTANGRVFYRVATESGLAEIGYPELPMPDAPLESNVPLFYEGIYLGERVRVASMARRMDPPLAGEPSGRVIVQVAESLNTREVFIASVLVRGFERDVLGILASVMLLVMGVMISLRPLARLREEIEARRADDLRPIDDEGLPSEVQPLVRAMNRHMQRYGDQARDQQQFLDDASHQLRTPLSVLRTQIAYALRESDPQEVHSVLVAMQRGVEHAVRMTNQLLALARTRDHVAARERLLADPVDLGALADTVMRALLPAARARQLDCGLALPGTSVCVRGAEWMLREALSNLVDNAIRYTPCRGRITVTVTAESGFANLMVDDEGPGMTAEERERAGTRFWRGDAGRDTPGAGLGLAIVKTIAHVHDAEFVLAEASPRGLRAGLRFPPGRVLGVNPEDTQNSSD